MRIKFNDELHNSIVTGLNNAFPIHIRRIILEQRWPLQEG